MSYTEITDQIRRTIDLTNRELGIDLGDWDAPKITFGYIGNCSGQRADGTWSHDDRMWSIYLPHPGRIGTDADRLGGFLTGDTSGALVALHMLRGFRKGLAFSGGPVMAGIRYAKASRIATD